MRTFELNKLVRDKIVEDMERMGQQLVLKKLSDDEYIRELAAKIREEAKEIDPTDKQGALKELADTLEAIEALIAALGSSKEEVSEIQDRRHEKRGGFANRDFVQTVTVADDDEWAAYYAKDPQKYPEIKE